MHRYSRLNGASTGAVMTPLAQFLPIFCFAIAAAATAYSQENTEPIFVGAEEALAEADSVNAPLLSPKNYALGKKKFNAARNAYASGEHSERIEKRLVQVEEIFRQAVINSERAASTFASTIKAREDAKLAEASRLAPTNWATAETQLEKAARELEDQKLESGVQYSAISEDNYRVAEFNAIRAQHLTTARRSIADAVQAKAGKFAPRTLGRAQKLLREADAALAKDRYRTAEAKALADEASYAARHAIYIAKIANRIQSTTLTLEDVILDLETPLSKIADILEIDAAQTSGYEKTTEEIIDSVQNLLALPDELGERDRLIQGLEEEIRELDARLRGASTERIELVREIESQAREHEQLELIGSLFTDEEALVLQNGNGIILRLVGLNFASNSSELEPEAIGLIVKAKAAVDIFPRSGITIEGHTDSSGDADRNLQLSKDRAQAVVDYMADKLRIPVYRMTVVGYGDTRPIANNKTAEGKAKNRRIDLIIVPKPGGLR